MRDDNRLPIATRQNLMNLGAFVLAETFSLMTAPKQDHVASLIQINRAIAAGLGSKTVKGQPQRAA
jgi:flagellar biosynthesis activator protein FlaF